MKFLFSFFIFWNLNGAWGASQDLDAELHFPVTKYVLKNGLTVLLSEDHSSPMVSYHTWYRVGSRDEHEGITGSAHMLEHMMFQGAKKYTDKQLMGLLGRNGVQWNAFTSNDYTGFYMNLPSDQLELIMDIEYDRMSSLAIAPSHLKSEKEVVKEERRLRTDNSPYGLMNEITHKTVFTKSNYRWPVIGWMTDIEKFSEPVLREFYQTYYVPNNAVLVLVGDFNTEKVKNLIEKYYGGLPARPLPNRNYPAEEPQISVRNVTEHMDIQAPMFSMVFPGATVDQPDNYALDVLATLLTTGSSSRLYKKLIYDLKIAAGASAGHTAYKQVGLFNVVISMKAGEKLDRAVQVVREELNRLQNEKVSEAELKKAKVLVMKAGVDGLMTFAQKARALASAEILSGSYEMVFADIAKYQQVTAEDLQRCAREYFKNEKQTLISVLPRSSGVTSKGAQR